MDLAISYEPEVLRARDKGLNVVSVGALVQRPLTSIISLPSAKISEPADLKGKTVGTAGIDYQSAYLRTILLEAGVTPSSVKERNVGFSLVPALLTGRVDATLGAFWNYEGVDLKLRGRKPRIIRVDDAGVPTYNELVLVANADALDRDGGTIRAFIGALSRGVRDLSDDPDGALDGLLEANRDLDPELQRAALRPRCRCSPRRAASPSPGRTRSSGTRSARGWRTTGCSRARRTRGGRSRNELLPGAGL